MEMDGWVNLSLAAKAQSQKISISKSCCSKIIVSEANPSGKSWKGVILVEIGARFILALSIYVSLFGTMCVIVLVSAS